MIRLDKYQKKVVDCNKNAVVTAGAGSGKTTVLAARFLRLIKEDCANVSEILTLTFTRKAASEMYQRIYKLLLEEKDNKLCKKAVDEFDRAQISTLDSFCSKIARDCSILFGIPPNFSTDEDLVNKISEEAALSFVLSKEKDNKYMQDFIYINGFEKVWKEFFKKIALGYLSIGLPKDFKSMHKNQLNTIYKELNKAADVCRNVSLDIAGIDSELKAVKSAKQMLKKVYNLPQIIRISIEPKLDIDGLRKIKTIIAEIKLLKSCGSSKKEEVLFYKEKVDEYKTAATAIGEMIGTLENEEFIKAMFLLTAEFQSELFELKRSTAVLGFNDVLSMAVTGLKNDVALRKHYKGLFKFIMIDEFQDNNILQKELLYLLAEKEGQEADCIPTADNLNPAKLFFVGDEKQSIYSFRGADVSVFKQLSGELERSGGISLSLKHNYRSEPDLIEFFNMVFDTVMQDATKDYQASFQPLQSREPMLKLPPKIRFLYKPYEEALLDQFLCADESEAHAIADFILANEGRLKVAVSDEVRFAEFADFAILFRSGSNQKYYERVFRARGIPYSVNSVRSLFQEAPVNDIYNLLQICLYPDDRTASAAFLRSPLINLSDMSVIQFMLSGKPVFAEGQDACCVSIEDNEKYQAAKNLFCKVVSMLDIASMADVVSYIWYKSGYRYLILHDSSLHAYLEHYDYLLEFAKKHDKTASSAAVFLDNIRENLGEYKKIDNLKVLGYSSGGVQMMPIHQSKGLEFPVVIVANMGNRGKPDKDGSAPAYISAVDGLSFNIKDPDDYSANKNNYFYYRGKQENEAKKEAELRRLLYVALTRAENHLVISGVHGRNNQKSMNSLLNIFLSAFQNPEDCLESPKLQKYIERINNVPVEENFKREKNVADFEKVKRNYNNTDVFEFKSESNEFSASELNASRVLLPKEKEIILPEMDSKIEEIIKTDSRENVFGTLCHLVIERTIKSDHSLNDIAPVLRDEIRENFKNFNNAEWDIVFDGAIYLSEKFFKSDLWRKNANTKTFISEMSFTALQKINGKEVYLNGVIDLLFEDKEQIQIIDFKTDRTIIFSEYDLQMSIYAKATQEIFSKPAKCSLFYLRGGVEIMVDTQGEDF